MNILVHVSLDTCAEESQEYIPRIGIAGLRIYTHSASLEIANLLSKVDSLVHSLCSKHISCFFSSSPNLSLSRLF